MEENINEQSREQNTPGDQQNTGSEIKPGAQATVNERIGNDGSHAATNDLSTEQLFELIRKQGEQIQILTGRFAEGTEVIVVGTEKKPEIPKEGVKFKQKTYDFTTAVFVLPQVVVNEKKPNEVFEGGRFTAEQAATDTDVIAAILAIKGQNILVERV